MLMKLFNSVMHQNYFRELVKKNCTYGAVNFLATRLILLELKMHFKELNVQ